MITFQDIIKRLNEYWSNYGCVIFQPYNSEVGAGTFNPITFLRVLGPKPWKVGYVEISKRPKDGRYGANPIRFQQHFQYQVIIKPSPDDSQGIYLKSLQRIGLKLKQHDVRFIEGDWESPTLGAWGLGWEVWLDGLEISQFTYFQQVGGLDLEVIPVELTYGLDRIAMVVQKKKSVYDVLWSNGVTWGELYHQNEVEFSKFNFEEADVELYLTLFDRFEDEAKRFLDMGIIYPGYDYVLKCSHIFNILDARGAISVAERKNYIARVRRLARRAALGWTELQGGRCTQ